MANTPPPQLGIDRPLETDYSEYGKELVHSALYGTLLAGGGAALYHLINGAKRSDPKVLLNDVRPYLSKQPTSGRPERKKEEEFVENPELKLAAADKSAAGLLHQFYDAVGHLIPNQFVPDIPTGYESGVESPSVAHRGWRTAANYLAAIGGGAGGLALVQSINDKKKKQDLEDEVNSARKEYFDALTGKEAEVLDAAYEKYAADRPQQDWSQWLANWGNNGVIDDTVAAGQRAAEGTWTAALLAALGSGAIGAKYMYDQTKARTSAENLQKARDSRARLKSIQQSPYMDPEELAAIAGR